MIEIELFDGTVLEFPAGTPDDVIDRVARQETASRGAASSAPEPAPAAPERTIGQTIYENVIGSGAVDTPGERIGEFVRGGTAAVARGMADVPALPANILQLGTMGVEKLFGMDQPSAVSRGLESLPDTRGLLAAVPVIGPESQYKAPGTAGEFISTAGEFAGGAGVMSGPKAMLKYGVAPGVASEAAGQATEGSSAEPYARLLAALAAPAAVGAVTKGVQKVVSPMAGEISANRQAAVDLLRSEGVRPTAGQIVGGRAAENQLYREAATATGRGKVDQAAGDFTEAVLRRVGSGPGSRATDDVLEAADVRIGGVFDDVTNGVVASPSTADLTKMSNALRTYRELSPAANAPPIFENVNQALVDAVRSQQPIAAETVKVWRSTMSKLTRSPDAATREAAIDAVEALDDVMDGALIAAGKPQDVARLGEARNQWRNLLAIEQAAARSDIEGIISPLALRSALLQQSRRKYVQGKGDLGPITKAASDILKPLPQSGTAPRVSAQQIFGGAQGGTAAGLGAVGLGVDPMTGALIGAATAAAPMVRNAALSSDIGQAYFLNQLMSKAGPLMDKRAVGMIPGLLSGQ